MGENRDHGFSLIELLVALALTLIVSASIMALLYAGQSSFRRNPELNEMEQNIRVAMESVMADVSSAGVGMPAFTQAFSIGLDGGAGAPPPADKLEIFGNDGSCSDVRSSTANGAIAAQNLPTCFGPTPGPVTVPVFFYWATASNAPVPVNGANGGEQWAVGDFSGTDPAKTFTPRKSNPNFAAKLGAASGFALLNLARYEIANDTDNMPCLWRSSRGGIDSTGNYQAAPNGAGGWMMIGRGITDMQVLYYTDAGWTTNGNAPTVTALGGNNPAPGDASTIITAVRVTLSARNEGRRALETGQAMTYRTQLTSVGVPRAALLAKQMLFPALKHGVPTPVGSWR